MNTVDILRYGHLTVTRTLDGVALEDWETPGVCGWWSVKNIIAHLASFEHALVEVLSWVMDETCPTPTLERYASPQQFNDDEVARRMDMTPKEVFDEYEHTHLKTLELAAQVPGELLDKEGVLPWYGPEYDLEDFIVYTFYGHKREHMAQVAVFKDTLKNAGG